ncbi:SDR family oxidoreductase [Polaromonas jejuensis]|uniref:SDR family oxidoreductase n=1 Tax=Polaromonas jejuensis TaxID=457502 RepID=A0ABW0QA20_9BURK|nr:SDR family oxidoreductase [Polaromonas jejuensis]
MSTVLVIGASRGIGLEFVRQYLEAGARVIATARDEAGLARLKALGAQPLHVDVSEPASISGLAWQLDGEKIDVALYVAGVYAKGGADTPPTREEFDRTLHTNVLGAMQTIPQVAPLVEAANHGLGGKFAFISSGMGQIGAVDSSFGWTYRVSKAALNMAVAAAQHDYPRAIMVALCPGWVRTDLGGPQAPLSVQQSVSAMRATLAALTPAHKGQFLQHDGTPYPSW